MLEEYLRQICQFVRTLRFQQSSTLAKAQIKLESPGQNREQAKEQQIRRGFITLFNHDDAVSAAAAAAAAD